MKKKTLTMTVLAIYLMTTLFSFIPFSISAEDSGEPAEDHKLYVYEGFINYPSPYNMPNTNQNYNRDLYFSNTRVGYNIKQINVLNGVNDNLYVAQPGQTVSYVAQPGQMVSSDVIPNLEYPNGITPKNDNLLVHNPGYLTTGNIGKDSDLSRIAVPLDVEKIERENPEVDGKKLTTALNTKMYAENDYEDIGVVRPNYNKDVWAGFLFKVPQHEAGILPPEEIGFYTAVLPRIKDGAGGARTYAVTSKALTSQVLQFDNTGDTNASSNLNSSFAGLFFNGESYKFQAFGKEVDLKAVTAEEEVQFKFKTGVTYLVEMRYEFSSVNGKDKAHMYLTSIGDSADDKTYSATIDDVYLAFNAFVCAPGKDGAKTNTVLIDEIKVGNSRESISSIQAEELYPLDRGSVDNVNVHPYDTDEHVSKAVYAGDIDYIANSDGSVNGELIMHETFEQVLPENMHYAQLDPLKNSYPDNPWYGSFWSSHSKGWGGTPYGVSNSNAVVKKFMDSTNVYVSASMESQRVNVNNFFNFGTTNERLSRDVNGSIFGRYETGDNEGERTWQPYGGHANKDERWFSFVVSNVSQNDYPTESQHVNDSAPGDLSADKGFQFHIGSNSAPDFIAVHNAVYGEDDNKEARWAAKVKDSGTRVSEKKMPDGRSANLIAIRVQCENDEVKTVSIYIDPAVSGFYGVPIDKVPENSDWDPEAEELKPDFVFDVSSGSQKVGSTSRIRFRTLGDYIAISDLRIGTTYRSVVPLGELPASSFETEFLVDGEKADTFSDVNKDMSVTVNAILDRNPRHFAFLAAVYDKTDGMENLVKVTKPIMMEIDDFAPQKVTINIGKLSAIAPGVSAENAIIKLMIWDGGLQTMLPVTEGLKLWNADSNAYEDVDGGLIEFKGTAQ